MSEFFNKKSKYDSKKFKLILKYLPCFLKGFLITALGILVLSFAYYKLSTHSVIIYYLTYLFIALGGFVAGNSTYHKLGGRGIVVGAIGALPVAVVIYAILAIFCLKEITAFSLIILPICILCGCLGGIIGSNSKKRY
ncbi:MAG: TIGR04086 family membrane protein [Ruminococcaceae bacterium]|nr:TIGR04086 family membrane protein [Oscillospiraceae bacterium]